MDGTIRLGIYDKALNPRLSMRERIHSAAELGFDGIQLCIDGLNLLPYIWSDEDCYNVNEYCTKEGIKVLSVSLSAHRYYGMASPDIGIRDFAVELLIKTIRFAKSINAEAVMLAGYDSFNAPPPANSWDIFRNNLMKVIHVAEREKINLLIENVDGNFINNCEKAVRMIKEINCTCLGIYFDIANCVASEFDPVEQIELSKHKILGIHAKETRNGDFKSNLALGKGEIDYNAVFKKLSEIGFHSEIVLENWYDGEECIEKYKYDIYYLKQLIKKYF